MEWTVEETKRLFDLCAKARKEGKGLKTAFETVAKEVGRKPNSVRNYYYAHLKTLNLMPEMSQKLGIKVLPSKTTSFKTFSEEEIVDLVRHILIEQGKGKSVRSITTEMAKGDKSLMLRLQNKYRSVVFRQRKKTESIMKQLRAEKITFYNPYTKSIVTDGVEEPMDDYALFSNLKTITASLDDEQVKDLFKGLARLVQMATSNTSDDQALDIKLLELKKKEEEAKKLAEENAALKQTIEQLKLELTERKLDSNLEQLREINRTFLTKADNDKIKSLGEYVSELGKILAKTK
ncbi:MAG TPA: SANT/Myb-like DNA-binding domain-containing protein [Clostridia bacterium]|jgi:ribosomal protein S18